MTAGCQGVTINRSQSKDEADIGRPESREATGGLTLDYPVTEGSPNSCYVVIFEWI